MRELRLVGHYGSRVAIDLCAPCHLVWFDVVESARLSGPGLLELIGEMAQAQTLAHQPLRPDLPCPRCRAGVRTVHNRSRWGRSLQLECNQGHGAYQSFAEFLNEKGLLRPMSSADRARALQRDGALHCVNCGGAVGATDQACSWCRSVPALVDVARLARALDPEGATAAHAVHRTGTAATALACQDCAAPQAWQASGAAQSGVGAWTCQACGSTLTAPRLKEAHDEVSRLGPALQQHAKKPAPEIVHRRLQAQSAGLQRQRDRAAAMQAEADARAGHTPWR
ncbi:MAG: hypothetical protein H7Z19_11595, partial [Chitinophagaceae bacterium]|nr:hypothetical protein [Rubrivivax sp.]